MTAVLATAIDISFVLVMLGIVAGFTRLVRGPSLPDRIVALDMMTVLIVSFCALYAILSGERAFVDVAIVLALIGFLATVALARFVDRRKLRQDRDAPREGGAQDGSGPGGRP